MKTIKIFTALLLVLTIIIMSTGCANIANNIAENDVADNIPLETLEIDAFDVTSLEVQDYIKFAIEDEQAIEDGAHVYVAYKCRFTNQKQTYTELQCYTGKIMSKRKQINDIVFYNALLKKQKNILFGLSQRIFPDDETKERVELCNKLIPELEKILK